MTKKEMTEKIVPRCPICGHRQADWVSEGQFTCKHNHPPVSFIVGDGFVTLLTKPKIGANIINKT